MRVGVDQPEILLVGAIVISLQLFLVPAEIVRRRLEWRKAGLAPGRAVRRPDRRRRDRNQRGEKKRAGEDMAKRALLAAAPGAGLARHLNLHPGGYLRSLARIASAVRRHSAAMVSVGLPVATVGNAPLPTR
jgi:hypothetical protein